MLPLVIRSTWPPDATSEASRRAPTANNEPCAMRVMPRRMALPLTSATAFCTTSKLADSHPPAVDAKHRPHGTHPFANEGARSQAGDLVRIRLGEDATPDSSQNRYFKANCTTRPSRAVEIRPAFGLAMFVFRLRSTNDG